VYTAFSGSHQDAIKKGTEALGVGPAGGESDYETWEVPYLPIDPAHLGRTYDAVIRVNSQSGKGGVAYVMKAEYGLELPRRLQIEFSKAIQHVAEDTGTEITPAQMWEAFEAAYLTQESATEGGRGIVFRSAEATTNSERSRVTAQLVVDGEPRTVVGEGGGPISAFMHALRDDLGIELEVVDYSEHAVSAGSDATAAAYVEAKAPDGVVRWGVGLDESILTASLKAVVSAVNRHRALRDG
jgi:2-isopropylmalate synthase